MSEPPVETEDRSAMRRYREKTARSRELYAEACEFLPGGNTRGVLYYPPYPAYIVDANGPRIVDADGNEYLDFLNNYTSLIHGHTPDAAMEAAVEAIQTGSAPGGPTPSEVDWARHLVERAPALEQIRFTNSGTEATMQTIRAARAYTGNDLIAKFEGGFHGTHDDVLVSVHPPTHLAGPADDPKGVLESAGVPQHTLDDVLPLPFNDADAMIAKLDAHRDDLAGVIVAPMLGSAVIPATDGFLEQLATYTRDHDLPLIFDEVISFRVAHGGAHAALGIEPDLVSYGKVIGGGFAVGAFGGRADLLAGYDPRGGSDVSHSGTFNGNPVTASAGLRTLEAFDEPAVDRLNDLADDLATATRDVAEDRGVALQVNQFGSVFNCYFSDAPVTNYREATASPDALEQLVFMELLDEGVRLAPKLMGSLSTPMGESEIDEFVAAFDAALGRLRPEIEARFPTLVTG